MQKVGLFLLLLVLIAGGVFFQRRAVMKAVAGTGILRVMYAQASVYLPRTPDVSSYNIYYKQSSDKSFMYAVHKIPASASTYTISYLKKNGSYVYKVSALGKNGKEIWWSDVK